MNAKAKRGQVCVVHTKHSYTTCSSPYARVETDRATVGIVVGVTREGEITRYKPIVKYQDANPSIRLDKNPPEGKYAITDPFDHGRAIVAVVERGSPEFDTVEAAREFLRPFLTR